MTRLFIFMSMIFCSINLFSNPESILPGRKGSAEVIWVPFGTTDVFFYMTDEKYLITKKIVDEINQEHIKLTVDINDFDCLTTEFSAIASKYPDPLIDQTGKPYFVDPIGHKSLESYAQSLTNLIADRLHLKMEGLSREINFIISQDAHKFHQDQSAKQFAYLNQRSSILPPCKIIQDLTLVDWDMSSDTFSATIVQDSLSKERFLLPLFPKEMVGMLFTQSPEYLTRDAHPSYSVPTIFPYHAVLSPIDKKADVTPGSSKGKRLSTVLRGVVLESELNDLKKKSKQRVLNRPTAFEDNLGKGLRYQNGIVGRELPSEITSKFLALNVQKESVIKYPDYENLEIYEFPSPHVSSSELAQALGIKLSLIKKVRCLEIIKKDSGFSAFKKLDLQIPQNSQIVLLNASELPMDYDYYNLAEDCTAQNLPWIQLYHFPPQMAFQIPIDTLAKLSLTPIEEILLRKAELDSMKTDGIKSFKKIKTKIHLFIFEKS